MEGKRAINTFLVYPGIPKFASNTVTINSTFATFSVSYIVGSRVFFSVQNKTFSMACRMGRL